MTMNEEQISPLLVPTADTSSIKPKAKRASGLTREEMRAITGLCINERLVTDPEVKISFPYLRIILGDWASNAAEFQAKINAFAHEFYLRGTWDWKTGTHVVFQTLKPKA